MKVLYANPMFLYYRIPYYKKLVELFSGNFYVIYSVNRYKQRPEWAEVLDKITEKLGNNAIPYERELIYDTYTKSFSKSSYEQGGKKLPIPIGLFKIIRKLRPDVIITEGFFQWTPLILLYGFFYNVPIYVGYERTLWTERNIPWFLKVHRRISNWFIKGYLINGSETFAYLKSLGIKDNKIHIGGMSADSKMLQDCIKSWANEERIEFKRKYISNNGILYLFSGKLCERKGVRYLLDAWINHIEKYPLDVLLLLGTGDLEIELKNRYKGINSIIFKGVVPYNEIYKYYAIANVFVIPTIEDNWSLVVPEAMSCGLPIATSIYNGCYADLIKEGENGTTFDTFDKKSILRALDMFHHHDLSELGRKSIELEKPFNTENCAIRTYNAILKNSK